MMDSLVGGLVDLIDTVICGNSSHYGFTPFFMGHRHL
jgi:hypothetical protein